VLSLLLALTSGGCNVIGYAAQTVAGSDKVDAVYALPKRSTVVVAEKYSNPSEAVFDDEPLASFVSDELRAHNAAVTLVPPERVYTMRKGSGVEKWRAMTIDAVGRAVGAEQVLYVNIKSLSVQVAPGSEMMKGQSDVRVWLVDSASGATVWPADASDGWPVGTQTTMYRREEGATESSVRTDLLRQTADRIAKLFYSYERS
jgi:hypothetical protein